MRGLAGLSSSQQGNIEIKTILDATLKYFERMNSNFTQGDNISYADKLRLMKSIYMLRILASRLLVVVRCSKNSIDINSNLSDQNQYIEIVTRKANAALHDIQSISWINRDLQYRKTPAPKLKHKMRFGPPSFNIYFYEFFGQRPPNLRMANAKNIGQRYFLFHNKEYRLIFKINSYGCCVLKKAKVSWPNSIPLDKSILKRILSPYAKLKPKNISNLGKLDQDLHHLYLTGQLVYLVQQLIKLSDDFNFDVVKKGDIIKIKFGQFFRPFNIFILSIRDGYIQFRSKTPMVNPDSMQPKYSFTDRNDASLFSFLQKSLIKIPYIPDKTRALDIVNYMHRAVVFTRAVKVYHVLCLAVATVEFPHFHVKMFFPRLPSPYVQIEIWIIHRRTMLATMDTKNGRLFGHEIFAPGTKPSSLHDAVQEGLYSLRQFVWSLMSQSITNYVLREDTHTMAFFPSITKEFLVTNNNFYVCFSFSRDFMLNNHSANQRVNICAVDGRFKPILSNVMVFNSHCRIKDCIRNIGRSNNTTKTSIVLLQLEKSMQERGWRVLRYRNRIQANVPPHVSVSVKVHVSGFWRVRVDQRGHPMDQVGASIFEGRQLSARFPDFVIHLTSIAILAGVYYNRSVGSSLAQSSPRALYKEDDLSFSVKLDRCKMHLDFGAGCVLYKTNQFKTVREIPPGLCPRIGIRFSPHTPLMLDAESPDPDILESFGSLLSESLNSIVHFASVFSSPAWTITQITPAMSFYLIFRGQMTLNIQLKPVRNFWVIIPKTGRSTNLHTPMTRYPPLYRMVILSHSTFRVQIDQCAEMCSAIDDFYRDISFMRSAKFIRMDTRDDSLVFHHPPDPIVVRVMADGMVASVSGNDMIGELSNKLYQAFKGSRQISLGFLSLIIKASKMEQAFGNFLLTFVDRITEPNIIDRIVWINFFRNLRITPDVIGFVFNNGERDAHVAIQNAPGFPILLRDNGNTASIQIDGVNSWLYSFLHS